jgi:hypothetical protein
MARLIERGHRISYLELSNRPNAEIRSRILQADFVVDEVFSDTPMAVFASEAATAGVPAVVGGYWAGEMGSSLPSAAIPPSAFVHPEELESRVERLVVDEAERHALGLRARTFVTERWRPELVAQRVLSLASGDTTEVILRHPEELTYCAGWGMPTQTQHEAVKLVMSIGGPKALGLSHNPRLEQLMIATAVERSEARR